jgi:hypothetical protein
MSYLLFFQEERSKRATTFDRRTMQAGSASKGTPFPRWRFGLVSELIRLVGATSNTRDEALIPVPSLPILPLGSRANE